MSYEPKDGLTELDDVDFHVCDHDDCLNSYSPYQASDGKRYCITHGMK